MKHSGAVICYKFLNNSIYIKCVCVWGGIALETGAGAAVGAAESSGAHLVCRRGMGREMQRKGSKVLLCFKQWGHVSEDLRGERYKNTHYS